MGGWRQRVQGIRGGDPERREWETGGEGRRVREHPQGEGLIGGTEWEGGQSLRQRMGEANLTEEGGDQGKEGVSGRTGHRPSDRSGIRKAPTPVRTALFYLAFDVGGNLFPKSLGPHTLGAPVSQMGKPDFRGTSGRQGASQDRSRGMP